METNASGLARIFGSSKALVVLLVVALSFAALLMGRATWEQVKGLLEWVMPVWLGAQGLEDAAKHIAAPKLEAAKVAAKATPSQPPGG